MKKTRYFDFMRSRPDRREIKDSWIQSVIKKPIKEEVQLDGWIRRWGRIPEAENRVLRVVLLEDKETIHNAYFDRSFKGEN